MTSVAVLGREHGPYLRHRRTMQLSVVIITFNEERNLARCLASVKSIADDVVVVDSFSTDATERIAKEHGARFVQHAFEGHIAQKNWGITQAKFPWVLSLDADEALDEQLQRSILAIKTTPLADGYTMHRLTNYCGQWIKHGGWYPDTKLRLWNSAMGKWTGEDPHDRYEMDAGATIAHLAGDLLHYSYYTIHDHIAQVNYFTDISAQVAFDQGKYGGLFRTLISPVAKFFKQYILQLGLLDGRRGLVIAIISAHAAFLKYTKLWELRRGK